MSENKTQEMRDLVILKEVYNKFFDVKDKIEKILKESKEYYAKIKGGRDAYFNDYYDDELSFEEIYREMPSFIKEADEIIAGEINRLEEFIDDMEKYQERTERIASFIFRLEDKLIKGRYDTTLECAGINIRLKADKLEIYYEFDNTVYSNGYIGEIWGKSIGELLDAVVNISTLKMMIGSLMKAVGFCCLGKEKYTIVKELEDKLKEIYDMIP